MPASADHYWQTVADIYASTSDNVVEPWYDWWPSRPAQDLPIALAAGALLEIGARENANLKLAHSRTRASHGALVPTLPAGSRSEIAMPLIPVSITGTGKVAIAGSALEIGEQTTAPWLHAFGAASVIIEVLESATPIRIEYLLNDTRFGLDQLQSVQVEHDGDKAAVSLAYSSATIGAQR